ncbi:alkaline phosphatase D [Halopolyspora algeriensis]|uniref:Alkaline phosphatase D n=1 Tax=Halopolyspora algeriensis TaxID=1500506 RepID=A0A368VIF1_9ACTN|nr:alkaline phosphatase D family protein [Halopolyspora algeriensis]RCW41065.1 alkaline phosphatase D [Halopolyspora algeriensis]TQM53851.1 alkaline phosphatase D [Halopolyspora algeriensis]
MSDPTSSSSSARSASRRQVLLAGTAGAAALGASALGTSTGWASAPRGRGPISDPFRLGVASGDPLPTGVVLWTRLAPEPLAEDGRGGMPDRPVAVQWQVAADEHFRGVVAAGTELARPEEAHSVHVEVEGLRPDTEYFYRFRVGAEISPAGRTKTAPQAGARLDRFAFAIASCQAWYHGYFSAYRHMATEDLDAVFFLGDYIYEYGITEENLWRHGASVGPAHGRETKTLAQYRLRHSLFKTDTDLQAAHAAFPWAIVFDDHEVENNWADEISENNDAPQRFLRRRARALQAYYEHMPLRRSQRPQGPDVQLYRRLTFGDLMDFYLLDTRQYRSDQVGDAHRADPNRTLLGDRQKAWLREAVAGPTARWNVLAQQVFFSQRDFVAGADTNFSNDAWDGYAVERNELRDHLAATASNPVVLTGDVHANYVADVKADFNDPGSATVATELVGTSITSGGDGQHQRPGDQVQLQENPHITFLNRQRGYVRNIVTPTEWTADFRTVDYVTRPGAPVRTRASYVIDNDRPGARPA